MRKTRKNLDQSWKRSENPVLPSLLVPSLYNWLPGKSCLVTGGGGFLGKHTVECLLNLGCSVRVLDLADSFPNDKVKYIKGNLCNKSDVERACTSDIDVVFHCATPNPLSQNKQLLHDVNVGGTELLLRVCEAKNIQRFVYTSSASVVFEGKDQQVATEAECPMPQKFRDVYSLTKAMAEQLVLKHRGGMKTVAIRPHGIFGPGDTHFFPTLEKNAIKGKTKFQIGDGTNFADFTFVGNVVHGLFLAADQLDQDKINRQAFFITNDEPLPFWDMLSRVLVGLGYAPPSFPLPYGLCYTAASIAETFAAFYTSCTGKVLDLTFNRSKVQLAGLHHSYSCEKAKKDLSYRPLWDMNMALACTFAAKSKVGRKTFTKEEVAQHNTATDAWIIVKNRVFDITEYVDEHPGGESILNDAGGDATEGFYGPQHPTTVEDHLEFYYIGDLTL